LRVEVQNSLSGLGRIIYDGEQTPVSLPGGTSIRICSLILSHAPMHRFGVPKDLPSTLP
jgi:hypothetical protein